MLLDWYQNLPLHISPIAFMVGSFAVRWYALAYVIGFGVVYFLLIWRVKHGEADAIFMSKKTDSKIQDTIVDFLLISFFSALIGGRLGYVLFYNFGYFFSHPLTIISPYDTASGTFVGIYGMSYHGALLGVIVSTLIFLRKKGIDFLVWADFVVPAAALGYFFGRMGNFFNGELYGRVTTSPLGMHFIADQSHLRHPSQIYEAISEGLVLFVILWQLRKKKLPRGILFITYLIGYGVLRIFAEFFRDPDPQIGFLFSLITMGQMLSLGMILGGSVLFWKIKRQTNKKSV